MNHQGNTNKTPSDPLQMHGGPITRARAKKIQTALNGLIEKIWAQVASEYPRHQKLGLQDEPRVVNIIQVLDPTLADEMGNQMAFNYGP